MMTGDWHIHTSFTDGEGSVEEYCERAVALGIPLVAFTEHVRRELDYDFRALLDQIDEARGRFDLIILSGCEAKVLPDGELDVSEEIVESVDCPVFAIHGAVRDKDDLISRVMKAIENPRVNSWAHPGARTMGTPFELDEDEVASILKKMRRYDVALEQNDKYGAPSPVWMTMARELGVKVVRGSDSHRVSEMEASFRRHHPSKFS